MPGTFYCNSGSCLPMVIIKIFNLKQKDYMNFVSRDIVVMVIGNVLMVVMN
jgi:hypothetical protein